MNNPYDVSISDEVTDALCRATEKIAPQEKPHHRRCGRCHWAQPHAIKGWLHCDAGIDTPRSEYDACNMWYPKVGTPCRSTKEM